MKRLSLLLFLLALPLSGQTTPFLTCCNGAGSGGGVTGLTSCSGGSAIADNALLRGDGTTGCQGSTATLADDGTLTLTAPLLLPFGTAAAPALAFAGATDRGIFGSAGGTFFAIAGVSVAGVSSNGDFLAGSSKQFAFANTATPQSGGSDVGLRRVSPGVVGVSDGGTNNNGALTLTTLTVLGRRLGAKGADVASAGDITLGAGNYFVITGTTTINTISATSWTAGTCVILQFSGSVTVKNATAGAGAQLKLAGSADFSATADDTLTACYDGTFWRETARTAI